MELIIAEKPSVARDLARVLGVPAKGPGAWRGGGRIVTWCLGHLVELDEPAAYDPAWKRWRLESLPMLPPVFKLRPTGNAGARAQWRVVRDLLRSREVTSVVNACDAGREGELIFRYCLELAGSRLPVRRLWISSLTDAAIRAGFARLAPGAALEPLADAARCRSEADWLVGMNATRAVTVKSRGGATGVESLMSVGRVQTPTLALIVERERAIRAFVAVRYAEVQGTFSAGTAFVGTWGFAGRSRLLPGVDVAVIARVTGKAARVERVERVIEREPPPLLFDLTGLQRTANKRYGFSAKKTLDLAQSLYEKHKLLSYPRTDSRHLPNDVRAELPAVCEGLALGALAGFAQQAAANLAGGARFGRVFDDRRVSDHHAIIPTAKPPDLARLDGDERRIYEMVARRFLGAFFPDAEIARTTVGILVGAPGPLPKPAADRDELVTALPPPPDRFVARGRVRLVAGWQEVAGFEAPHDDEQALPALAVDAALSATYAALAKQTQPPRRFTEATLLAAMEAAGKEISDDELRLAMKDRGLGTPATRASTIETLLDRHYVERAGKALAPTPLGEGLIARLPVESLASAELTGRWEARLARMARGEAGESRAAFMADIRAYVAEVVAAIVAAPMATAATTETAAAPVGFCPLCRDGVVEKFKFFACGSCAFKLWKSIAGKRISPALAGVILRAGRTRELPGFRSKAGKRFAAAIVLDETGATKLVFEGREGETAAPAPAKVAPAKVAKPAAAKAAKPAALPVCPRCTSGRLVVGKRAWGCSRWRDGCPLVIPFAPAGKPLTRAQLERLVSHGVTRKTTAGRVRLDATATPPTVIVESV